MRRYLLVSLAIGFLVATVVLVLYSAGIFSGINKSLSDLYEATGFFPPAPAEVFQLQWLEILMIVAVSLAAAWCIVDIPQIGHKMLVFLTFFVLILGLSPTLALYGYLFEPVSSILAAFLSTVSGLIYAGTEQGMRKRVLTNVFGERISPAKFSQLLDSREPLQLDGATREASVLTVRLFNHAELREKMEPSELLALTNMFLRSTADFLKSRGAFLDESSPDCVRVFFGLLEKDPDHAVSACRTALELKTRLKNLDDDCENRWFQRLSYGVAIASSPVTVGVFGSPQHYYYSGMGGETDFCRRLTHSNLRYHSDILISASTQRLVSHSVLVRPMDMLYDPSLNLMSEVYQIVGLTEEATEADTARRDAFWQGVIHYRSGKYEEALEKFAEAQLPGRGDGPLQYFTDRCQHLLVEGAERPDYSHDLTDQGHARLVNMM